MVGLMMCEPGTESCPILREPDSRQSSLTLEALVRPGSDPLKPFAPDSYPLWDKIYLTWLTCLSSNTLRWSAMTGERAQPTLRVVLLRNESLIVSQSRSAGERTIQTRTSCSGRRRTIGTIGIWLSIVGPKRDGMIVSILRDTSGQFGTPAGAYRRRNSPEQQPPSRIPIGPSKPCIRTESDGAILQPIRRTIRPKRKWRPTESQLFQPW